MRHCTPADAALIAALWEYTGPDLTMSAPSVEDVSMMIAAETWVVDEDNRLFIRLVVDHPKAPVDRNGVKIRVWPYLILPTCALRTATAAQFTAAFKLLGFACGELLKVRPELAPATCGGRLRGTMLTSFQTAGGLTTPVVSGHRSVYNTVQFVITAAAKVK